MKRPTLTIKNYLMRHLQVMLFSLGRLWQQPLSSLMTTTVIGIALALPAGLFVLLQNIEDVSEQWNDSNQISVFLEQNVTKTKAQKVIDSVKKWPEIKHVHFQSAAQSLLEFRELSGLDDLLNSLPNNPLPAVITITPHDDQLSAAKLDQLITRLKTFPHIDQIQLDMAWLQRLRSINELLHRGISLLAALLFLSVLLVIGNTIRLAILNRQSEIKVMKLVGATDRFIRRPFLYTGFWYGLSGGFFAWLTVLITLILLNEPVYQLAQQYSSHFELQWFAGSLLFYLPAIGTFLGIMGAWLAVGRHLNAIEPD